MNFIEEIEKFKPYNEQEENDKKLMLEYINKFDDTLTRKNAIGHFTASAFAINKDRNKILMAYHKIYNSWAWLGGHADGEDNLLEVAIREVKEESGVKNVNPIINTAISLEILPVSGHVKRGKYVSSHQHLNLTYLLEVDENEKLTIKEDENTGVKWIPINEIRKYSTETNMYEIYDKIIEKIRNV